MGGAPGLRPSSLVMEVIEYSGLVSMSRASRIRLELTTLGRPPTRPQARAAASPSRVLATMNSAGAANTWKTRCPPWWWCRASRAGK